MEKGQFTITKSHVESYKVRHSTGMYWADITIDSNDCKGRIQIASDFGDYQYYWGACGSPFKEFLLRIGIHYAAAKFGTDRWFDSDKTISDYKHAIRESRQCQSISREEARELYDELKNLADCIHEHEFVHIMWEQRKLMNFFDNCPDLSRDISPQFKTFWKHVWPVFLNELRNELSPVI
jgi:hypothetical protein